MRSGAATDADLGSARRGADWIVSRQAPDGAFFSSNDPAHDTARALAAAVAGGVSGHPVAAALDYLRANAQADATEGGNTGLIVAGIVAGGADPRRFGRDYVEILNGYYDPATGAYDDKQNFENLVAINGLLAAREPLQPGAIPHVEGVQCQDGGFAAIDCSQGSDTDTTALAVAVLVAAGHRSDPAVARARSWLAGAERPDGGFGYSAAQPETNADSTGLALSAIVALGEDPHAPPWKRAGGSDPAAALRSLQTPSGGFRWKRGDSGPNALATVDAVPGLAGVPYPIQAQPSRAPAPARPQTAPPSAPTVSSAPTRPSASMAEARAKGGGSPGPSLRRGPATGTPALSSALPNQPSPTTHVLGSGTVTPLSHPLGPALVGLGLAGVLAGSGLALAVWLGRRRALSGPPA